MATIVDTQTIDTEIVLSERRVTTEFVVVEVHESIRNRFVRAEIELGPFTTETFPDGREEIRGSGRRGVTVWENDAYDEVRDTWRNDDLLGKIKEVLNG